MLQYIVFLKYIGAEEEQTMAITKNAQAVLEKRYLIRDEHGEPMETVDDQIGRAHV